MKNGVTPRHGAGCRKGGWASFQTCVEAADFDYQHMTRSPKLLMGILSLVALFLGVPASGQFEKLENEKEDPNKQKVEWIIGKWVWMDKQIVECNADGTFTAKPTNRKGTWRVLDSKANDPKYEFKWDEGLFVDTLTLSRDHQKLRGKNEDGKKIEATKEG